ncbi:MAG: hypothetical protein ACI4PO_09630 [Faecousia sp.]
MLDKQISQQEIAYLRELAKKQLEYANLPVMRERERLWYLHNALQGERTMVVMEEITFLDDIVELKCEHTLAREIEYHLLQNIIVAEDIDDDKVIPDFYNLEINFDYDRYGIKLNRVKAEEGLGFHVEPALEDLEEDLCKLKPTEFSFDWAAFQEKKAFIEEVIGDILPVKVTNAYNCWEFALTAHVVELMGTENMFIAMMDTPDEFHQLMNFITDDCIRLLRWEEENGYLFLNNRNDYMGSGSFCFNKELPGPDFDGKVRSIHTWGHTNSQESVGISPAMYREFVLPYIRKISKEFGLMYYGCCEPVSDFWENGVETIPNLRKVSISAWCNEDYMAQALKGRPIIYSRKPSPNFLGVQKEFDEEAFRAYIRKTAQLTRDLPAEIIFRDIYKLHGNKEKLKRAVQIVREETCR